MERKEVLGVMSVSGAGAAAGSGACGALGLGPRREATELTPPIRVPIAVRDAGSMSGRHAFGGIGIVFRDDEGSVREVAACRKVYGEWAAEG